MLTAVVVSGLALWASPAHGGTGQGTRHATTQAVRGVTRGTVVVGGLLAATSVGGGADTGAQARFRRANRAGGVAGRRVRYRGTEVDAGDPAQDSAAVARLGADVFAVVPAISTALDTAGLARTGLPFFGAADSAGWNGNRFGFGFAGAQAAEETQVVNPAWGVQLRALLGRAQGNRVVVVGDTGALGGARVQSVRVALRAAGFEVPAPIRIAPSPSPVPDITPEVQSPQVQAPRSDSAAAVVLLTMPETTAALSRQLVASSFTGAVVTTQEFYQPAAPEFGNGLTVMVPYAPPEQSTAANRRLVADVEAFAPGTRITAAVIAGYWAADQFLAVLARAGRNLSVPRLLAAANSADFVYQVPDTVGPSTWPAMHSRPIPCGALVQSDGSRYYVVGPYRCDPPIVGKPRSNRSKSARP